MKIAPTLIGIVAGLVFVSPVGAATAPHQGRCRPTESPLPTKVSAKVDRETILLIGGTGMQLTDWPTEFCEEMVRRGYRVVIYDNRDIGLSTRFDAAGMPDFAAVVQAAAAGKPAPLAYTLYDMANDAVGLLDALGISKAHIVGASMGGMIAQIVATNHPEHTLSLTSIMATDGKPGLPIIANPERVANIRSPAPNEDKRPISRAWSSHGRRSEARHTLKMSMFYRRITRDVERSYCLACEARQGAASLFTAMEDRRLKLQTIHVPTVVVQGDEDPIIAMEAARDVAVSIQGAKLRVIHGMGDHVPPALVKTVADAIVSAASRADHRPTDEKSSDHFETCEWHSPADQYLMADRNAEIALARSAAPDSISRDAEVLVLGRHGYETAVKVRTVSYVSWNDPGRPPPTTRNFGIRICGFRFATIRRPHEPTCHCLSK